MSRNVPTALAAHLAGPATTVCYLLKIVPETIGVAPFGICTLDRDVTYDDGGGALIYYSSSGYTAFDVDTKTDMSVDSSEAQGLLASYPLEGVTLDGIARGDYDSARFLQYLVNYEDLSMGHAIINAGQVGEVTSIDDLTCTIELRSLTQILKQLSIIEVTSITCRAQYGDLRCKMPLSWYDATVDTLGAENDRDFTLVDAPGFSAPPGGSTASVSGVPFFTGDGTTMVAQLLDTAGERVTSGFTVTAIYRNGVALTSGDDYSISGTGLVQWLDHGSPPAPAAPTSGAVFTWDGTLPLAPDGYFAPGVVQWVTGANAGRENDIESYTAATGAVVLSIPTYAPIAPGDTLQIRRDCDKSKTTCISRGNFPNMRAEPELPRADGSALQSPISSG